MHERPQRTGTNGRLCFVVTASFILRSLYKNQYRYWLDNGFRVQAVSSPGPEHRWLREIGVNVSAIGIARKPSPLNDLVSLLRLLFFFSTHRFDVINVSTPKAALLGAIAARLSLQRNIVYTIRGRPYEHFSGMRRRVYLRLERLICLCSAHVYSISREIRDDFVSRRICRAAKISVLGHGSSNGVDLRRFTVRDSLQQRRNAIRLDIRVGTADTLYLYAGRIARDKGIEDLVQAFTGLQDCRRDVHLLLVGFVEADDPPALDTMTRIEENPRIHLRDWCWSIEEYYAAADVFVFPSYREGFGNVALEASAMQLPVIGYDAVGVRESVADGVSGILCPLRDIARLTGAMDLLASDTSMRKRLGRQGRRRVEQYFDSHTMWDMLRDEYRRRFLREG